MKRYIVLSVGCLVFVSVAGSWLWNAREVSQDWRPSREPAHKPSAPAKAVYEVPEALKDIIEAERRARQHMLPYSYASTLKRQQ